MRVAGPRCAVALALSLAACAGSRAEAVEAALVGAWVENDMQCEDVFSRAGKGTSFKRPVNVFAPAFIITGNQVRTAQASCRINGVKPVGERRILSLSCATTIAVDSATAILAPSPDGSLRRFTNDKDTAGSTYKRCTL